MKIYYFVSAGFKPILSPPELPPERGVGVDDLYIHTSNVRQAWRCTSVKPSISWEEIVEGKQEPAEDGKTRTFVITTTGLPGWVMGPTIDRKYKHKAATGHQDEGAGRKRIGKDTS
jgi:hypothetical protein